MARILTLLFLLGSSVLAIAGPATKTVLILGDSLSAGFGIAVEQSWPALLQQRLEREKRPYVVANASISGETTAGGRARLGLALERQKPALLVLALGANDGLRGLPVAQMRANLQAMIQAGKKTGARVLLVGMKLPPNYGPAYTRDYEAAFADLAREESVPLVPFLLEPIATDGKAFLADGLHPTAAAQPRILGHLWPALAASLK
ncbi:MAG: arylesterase [Rhodocyclaceae bacterium]|nr:arylesterase [Rhodocyclaceae bacterium]